MISTVTTATVSTITAATLAGSLGIIGILVLLSLLAQKELTASFSSEWLKRLNRGLQIGILPLLIAFIMIVLTKVVAIFH